MDEVNGCFTVDESSSKYSDHMASSGNHSEAARTFGMKFHQEYSNGSTEDDMMDQSSASENGLQDELESESRAEREVEKYADVNYYPCWEASSQHSNEMEPSEEFTEDNSVVQNFDDEYESEQSDNSSEDSNGELFDKDDLADLLQRNNSNFRSGVTTQSMVEVEDIVEAAVEAPRPSIQPVVTVKYNTCLLCNNRNFSSVQALKIHIERKHGSERNHVCTHCNKTFSAKSNLNHHIKYMHGDRTYDCDKCDFSSKYNQRLKIHIATVHLLENPQRCPTLPLGEKSHQCPHCDYRFTEESDLTQHVGAIHSEEKFDETTEEKTDEKSEEKPNESSSDEKIQSEDQNLDDQNLDRSVQSEEKRYSCDQCDFKCSFKNNLTRHQRTVHDGVMRFTCDQCEYRSSSKNDLNAHWKAVHCNEKLYTCTECFKEFRHAVTLRRHNDAVHKGLKPYSCTVCDSKFAQSGSLQKHIKAVHLNEKPYSCLVCGKSFTQSSNLNSHMKATHG